MKSKLKQLLLCVLSVSALNFSAFAENAIITSSTTEANESYNDSDPAWGALNVTGNGVVYDGTNITLSATNSNSSGYNYYNAIGTGVYISGYNAILSLADSTITTSGSGGHGISFAEFAGGGVTLNNVTIVTTGNEAWGVQADYLSLPFTMNGGSITTSGSGAVGFYAVSDVGATASNVNIATTGAGSHGVEFLGSLTLTDNDIRVTGSGAYGIHGSGNVTANLNGNTLSATGADGGSIYAHYGTVTVTGSNGSLITGDVVANSDSTINISLSGAGTEFIGNFVLQTSYARATLTLGDGARVSGGSDMSFLTGLTLTDGAILGFVDDYERSNYLLYVVNNYDDSNISISGDILIDFSGVTVEDGDEFYILGWDNGLSGVSETSFTATGLGPDMTGSFKVDNSGQCQLTFTASAVPEPSTYFLIGTGLGLLLLAAHCRRQARTDA
jgi:hypothetical protein